MRPDIYDVLTLVQTWDHAHPLQGSLVAIDRYEQNPADLSCMCAQGQLLYAFGNFDPYQLRDMAAWESDDLLASLMNISLGHAVILRAANDFSLSSNPAVALLNPSAILGQNWSQILDLLWAADHLAFEKGTTAKGHIVPFWFEDAWLKHEHLDSSHLCRDIQKLTHQTAPELDTFNPPPRRAADYGLGLVPLNEH